MTITPALVRPARCSRSARASVRFSCSRSALLGRRGGPGGGGTRGPRIHRPLNGRHFGPPNRQFHDKLSRLYGSFGSSIGTSRVNAFLAPSMRQSETSRSLDSCHPRRPSARFNREWPQAIVAGEARKARYFRSAKLCLYAGAGTNLSQRDLLSGVEAGRARR
jgi:hypothetical protein